MDNSTLFSAIDPRVLHDRRSVEISAEDLDTVRTIVNEVRSEGSSALRRYAQQYDALPEGADLMRGPDALLQAYESLDRAEQSVLHRCAERIEAFARAQREVIRNMETSVPGGRAGHRFVPMEVAGCYAPGGRFPLPSSVLMTVVTAKTAGVKRAYVASPNPSPIIAAAAHIAGADGLLAVGGAQAIAAMAYGVGPSRRCDIIVGPGNRYVTAAKQFVSGAVAIDMLAGPSELVILADHSADPAIVAADLLAQAEHDPDAWPLLITTDRDLPEKVHRELEIQLEDLPTAATAKPALQNGGYIWVESLQEALALCDRMAPEHVELLLEFPDLAARELRFYGGLFIGSGSPEVFGDYGVGPNHVLPTAGTGRHTGGLSVLHFLTARTWLKMDDPAPIAEDAARLARLEGLEAHARAAEIRLRRK